MDPGEAMSKRRKEGSPSLAIVWGFGGSRPKSIQRGEASQGDGDGDQHGPLSESLHRRHCLCHLWQPVFGYWGAFPTQVNL